MIHPFETNYFYTPNHALIELPEKQTHKDWMDANRPGESRESLCEEGWYIIATFTDRHVIQLSGMNYGKLRTIHEILLLLTPKEHVVIQTGPAQAYTVPTNELLEIDSPSGLWAYKFR
jgi:hypothetical protein